MIPIRIYIWRTETRQSIFAIFAYVRVSSGCIFIDYFSIISDAMNMMWLQECHLFILCFAVWWTPFYVYLSETILRMVIMCMNICIYLPTERLNEAQWSMQYIWHVVLVRFERYDYFILGTMFERPLIWRSEKYILWEFHWTISHELI